MSGLDKIIEHIESSANESALKILEDGKAEAAKISAKFKAEADEKAEIIKKQADADVLATSKRIQSEADLTEKRFLLKAKQEAIETVLASARKKLESLSDKEYFETILKMIKKYSSGRDGYVKFSAADLKRMPANFQEMVNSEVKGAKLSVSDEPVNINGGFILEYGDIEENCSFDALFESSRENLQDKIGQILFEE